MQSLSIRHTQLLLKKHAFDQSHYVEAKKEQQSGIHFINSNGIVSPVKLMLIVCLIILSISNLQSSNNSHWAHVKALTNYFSYYALGQNNLGIYDQGDNVDETYIEITAYSDMIDHFENLFNFVQNYTVQGFATFSHNEDQPVEIEFYYADGSSVKTQMKISQLKQIILNNDMRQLLLSLRVLYFEIDFGSNELINNFKLVLDYEIYSHSMLRLDMSTKYKQKQYEGNFRSEFVLRNLERLFAMMLLIAYSIQARQIYYNDRLEKIFRKNSLYWCISLVLLNFVALTSNTLAPLCAMMQLLPIFENSDSSESLTYNFNVNLRYALPIVFRIIIPVYIILSGFILYSMLMYPGDYFDDYITGFFSYFYNNFQYGIYQIFIQIKSSGNVAYLMYGILYFHMVLVGSNLVPALFCTLIYQKMAEKQLVKYVQAKLQLIVCPKCQHQNYTKEDYGMEININSPKSPYIKLGTKLKNKASEQKEKMAKMYIQQGKNDPKSPSMSPIQTLKNKHKRARDLISQLNKFLQENKRLQGASWVSERLEKIQFVLNNF